MVCDVWLTVWTGYGMKGGGWKLAGSDAAKMNGR